MAPEYQIKLASAQDLEAIVEAGDSIFDYPVKPNIAEEFLRDPRHHMALAFLDEKVVGMASGFDYLHPDKNVQFFINEAGVADEHQGKGIGRELVKFICRHAKSLGCKEAWVGTEKSNIIARKAYAAAGGVEAKEPFILIEFDL
ncbi:MAG: GNAT family N-acetyltransferase [Cyclobacteriaceae bacterium]